MTIASGSTTARSIGTELDRDALAAAFRAVRARTEALVEGLSAEDLCVQAMPDASPGKWHLAHTAWFFEAMVLESALGQLPVRPDWRPLFNSYYEALGARHPRPQRGLLSRPDLGEVLEYRHEVDARMLAAIAEAPLDARALDLIELGLQHEQQHQELLVTDIKLLLWHNPLRPAWHPSLDVNPATSAGQGTSGWIDHRKAGPVEIGATASGFAFDNERPRHTEWVTPYALATRPVSNGEFAAFIAAGGYDEPRWWLSEGWDHVRQHGWRAPLYWEPEGDAWSLFTVFGMQALMDEEPVCHLSYFEADAYARWAGARLPTEAEWEAIAQRADWTDRHDGGAVWEWTGSAYLPYPGYRPYEGLAGEYNGKFMSGQMVLRGGSCATPRGHARASYRNFFPPTARWQFSGLRLAKDLR